MTDAAGDAARLLSRAGRAAKCSPCGCAHGAVAAVRNAPSADASLAAAADGLAAGLEPVRYDCLGCKVCWPARALAALSHTGMIDEGTVDSCAAAPVEVRTGWPPLPGAYRVARWSAPVAVCTLADADLASTIADAAWADIGIVGTLATENLGIERLVRNVSANPNLRYVIVCGTENRQAVGHLPGSSLVALGRSGIDEDGRIIGALGRRPFLRNVASDEVESFRATVEVIDLVGETDTSRITAAVAACAAHNPGPADRTAHGPGIPVVAGQIPARMTADDAGYFVVDPDRHRRWLRVEHYTNDGVLDVIVEGPTAAHCYMTAIERGLVSRLDHAAYLGKELARAHDSLERGAPFIQDAAPETASRTSPGTH